MAVELLEHVVVVHKVQPENRLLWLTLQHELAGACYANGQVPEAAKLLLKIRMQRIDNQE